MPVDLETIFKTLMDRAKVEDCFVNIYKDAIWLKDVGFGFDDGCFCVKPVNCKNDDEIAKWKLPKLKFLQSNKKLIEFNKLLKDIDNKNKKESLKKIAQMQKEKDDAVKNCIWNLINKQ